MNADKKIIVAEQDLVDTFWPEIVEIVGLLGFAEGDYMVTDESTLWDFACCYPEHDDHYQPTKDRHQNVSIWESWVKGVWANQFPGLPTDNLVDIPLVRLAQTVQERRNVQ
ncbi:MAG: hypothetical protein ACYCY2_11415 [Acidithiobacillus ferriphilus]